MGRGTSQSNLPVIGLCSIWTRMMVFFMSETIACSILVTSHIFPMSLIIFLKNIAINIVPRTYYRRIIVLWDFDTSYDEKKENYTKIQEEWNKPLHIT